MAYDFSKLNILLVEDNQYMRGLLRELLRGLGVRAECLVDVSNGVAALETMKEFPADLIITDWKMAPMDGLTLTRKIRTDDDSPNPFIPIILCTGFTELEKVEQARDSGVTEVLAKPIDAKTLYERIRSIIENPRPFTKSDDYIGPDRRRRTEADFEAKRSADHEVTAEDPDTAQEVTG